MNKYVIAFISFHDNVLTQEIVEAESDLKAMQTYLGGPTYADVDTVQKLKSFAFDCDSMISAFQI